MKTIRIVLAAAIALAVLPMVGCTSTGSTPSGVTDWLNSPKTQAQLGQLQDFAFTQALKLLGGAFGDVRAKAAVPATDEQIIAKLSSDAAVKFPDLPKDARDQQVAAAFARAKARKRSG
jgi:hypothetical protein